MTTCASIAYLTERMMAEIYSCESCSHWLRLCSMTTPERERELATPRGRIPADTLSNRLILARALAGHLSIREAASLCGLGHGAWTKWERGSRPLDLLEVTAIVAEKLDVDLEWLRFGGPLEGPRGRPVTRTANVRSGERPGGDTAAYRRSPERPTVTRPNVRGDQRAPMSYPGAGRRPVRVGRADTLNLDQQT